MQVSGHRLRSTPESCAASFDKPVLTLWEADSAAVVMALRGSLPAGAKFKKVVRKARMRCVEGATADQRLDFSGILDTHWAVNSGGLRIARPIDASFCYPQ